MAKKTKMDEIEIIKQTTFNQSKLDNWYAIELSKRFGTQDTIKLRVAEGKYGITTDKEIVYK